MLRPRNGPSCLQRCWLPVRPAVNGRAQSPSRLKPADPHGACTRPIDSDRSARSSPLQGIRDRAGAEGPGGALPWFPARYTIEGKHAIQPGATLRREAARRTREGRKTIPYYRLFYHVVWATRLREPAITDEREEAVWEAVRWAAQRQDLLVHAVGGYRDHVHLVLTVPPQLSLATVIGRIKGASSRWLGEVFQERFGWQSEYGVLSIGEDALPRVVRYVEHQRVHHTTGRLIAVFEEVGSSRITLHQRGQTGSDLATGC